MEMPPAFISPTVSAASSADVHCDVSQPAFCMASLMRPTTFPGLEASWKIRSAARMKTYSHQGHVYGMSPAWKLVKASP